MTDTPNEHPEQTSAAMTGSETAASSTNGDPSPSVPPAGESENAHVDRPKDDQAPAEQKTDVQAGMIRRGQVTEVTAEHVTLNLGDSKQGSIPIIEFAGHPTPKPGDEVSVIVEKDDPATGEIILSKRHADEVLFWHSVQPGELLEGVVTGMNKGGLDIDIGGARAFLPSSQVDTRPTKDISVLIGEHIKCVVTQVDRTTQDLVVSRKKVLEKERKQKRKQLIESLVEGETRKGKVSNITDYGAFVDLGGVDGLVHITDLSWARLKHPSQVVASGQELEVKILKVDRQKGKVSLGYKQLTPDPWESVATRYPVDSHIKGRIARLADFGAFIELEQGVDALLPTSEMSWSHRIHHPSEVVKVGDEIEAVVLKVEAEKHRISLGLKQLTPDPWSTVETSFPVDQKFKGKVSKLAEFGAFVELTPGLEGLIHISELADRRVNAVSDIVKEGQEVEVRVIKIDTKAQRISLSMRPPRQETPGKTERASAKSGKRKKPLRGGLSSHFDW